MKKDPFPNLPQKAMKPMRASLISSFLLVLAAMPAFPVEHPGTLPAGAKCAFCHADKITGKSIHSAMEASCTACHLQTTKGDMTTVNLAVPKDQLCFVCHLSTGIPKHPPNAKAQCLDCHDAHRSGRRWLLRERISVSDGRLAQGAPLKATANHN